MSHVHDIFNIKKVFGKSPDLKIVGVTKYEVIDEDYVEVVTATEDGDVAVIIRRGSLELPPPSKAVVTTSQPPTTQGLPEAALV